MKRIGTISLIILAFSFLAFLIVGGIYAALTKPDWETIDSKTVGTITKISPGRGGGAWFTYVSDGELHEEFDGLYQYGMTLGEKYWIKYCSTCSSTFTSKIKAIEYLKKTGISPNGFADFLYRLGEKDGSLGSLSWISTHPDSKERAKYIREESKGR